MSDSYEDEDLITIKFRTYKKCKRQLVISFILVTIALFFIKDSSIRYLPMVIGCILGVSSFFGIISNKLTKEQMDKLRKQEKDLF